MMATLRTDVDLASWPSDSDMTVVWVSKQRRKMIAPCALAECGDSVQLLSPSLVNLVTLQEASGCLEPLTSWGSYPRSPAMELGDVHRCCPKRLEGGPTGPTCWIPTSPSPEKTFSDASVQTIVSCISCPPARPEPHPEPYLQPHLQPRPPPPPKSRWIRWRAAGSRLTLGLASCTRCVWLQHIGRQRRRHQLDAELDASLDARAA